MQIADVVDRYRHARYRLFEWKDQLSVSHKLGLSFVFACLTGLMAQVRITLPFTPVPVTGQVLAVLLSGIFLGGRYGCLSQAFYVGLGTMGIPWFSGAGGGLARITSITGGYLIGFIPSALIVGWLTNRYAAMRRFHFQLTLMAFGVFIIYVFGAAHFAIVMHTNFLETIKLAVLPFISVDLMKSAISACISTSILPKRANSA